MISVELEVLVRDLCVHKSSTGISKKKTGAEIQVRDFFFKSGNQEIKVLLSSWG